MNPPTPKTEPPPVTYFRKVLFGASSDMKALRILIFCVPVLLGVTCKPTEPPPKLPPITISCVLPILTRLPETDEKQKKGRITISVAPVSFKAERGSKKTRTQVQPNFGERLVAKIDPRTGQPFPFVEDRVEPFLKPEPDRLAFLIKINNEMPRVFRGAGTVVGFTVAGKLFAVDQTGYGEMLAAIIPSRTEMQLRVSGPTLDTLPVEGTIRVSFDDVVTDMAEDGAITKKENFEWFFNYSKKQVEEKAEVETHRGQLIPQGH